MLIANYIVNLILLIIFCTGPGRFSSCSHRWGSAQWYDTDGGTRTTIWYIPFLYASRFSYIQSSPEWNGSSFQWINSVCENKWGLASSATARISTYRIGGLANRKRKQGNHGRQVSILLLLNSCVCMRLISTICWLLCFWFKTFTAALKASKYHMNSL